MSLSDFSIRNSVFAWMLMAGLILFGGISLRGIGISEMPDVDFPIVTINVTYRGAAPEIMESNVVDIIEESVMTVQGIRSVSSTSKQESGSIIVEFELNRDIDLALQEIQTKIAQATQRLPKDIDPPVVTKSNPEDQPIMWLGFSGDHPMREVIEYARDHIKDKLQTVSGVGEIVLSGYVEPNLRIWIDPEKLNHYELTVQDVLSAIEKEHIEIPAGRIETEKTEFNLRFIGEALDPKEFSEILITRRGAQMISQPIRIGDVATVVKGLDDVRRISRTEGQTAIGLGIKKQRGFNSVKVADEVKKRMEEIAKNFPAGYKIGVNFDTTEFIRKSIHEMQFELFLSALFTGLVCLLFLASFSSTFNILLAIPTSIIGSFLFVYLFGFTLNNFTLLALTLVIGIVVDDAIMVLENIVRHQEMGKRPWQAAIEGTREITSAAVATTVAIIAIFIPVVFMKGIIGKLFFQFGVVLTVTVALSLLEAITLTPMRSARMNFVHNNPGSWARMTNTTFKHLSNGYHRALAFCLNHRALVLIGSLLIFIASLATIPSIRKEFAPAQDQSSFLIMTQTPLGSSIDFTSERMTHLEAIVAKRPEVRRYFVAVGGFSGGEVNHAIMFISMLPPESRPKDPQSGKILTQQQFMDVMRTEFEKIPNIRSTFQDLSTRGLTSQRGFPVEISVRGADWNILTESSQKLMDAMKKSEFLRDVDTDYQFGQPEIQIFPLRHAAAEHGVRIEDIGKVVSALVGGIKNGKFTESGRRNDIRIRLDDSDRQTAESIKKLWVRNDRGELVSLAELVQVKERQTLQSITRRDRERAVGLTANVGAGKSQQDALKEVERLAKEILPEGYRLVFSGSAQTFQESFDSLFFALWIGVIIAYMVLASQYNSFIHPITVLLALPFSLSGAFVALWLFDQSLNLYSFIGLILLMGIAKKNSILLVDFTNQLRATGQNVHDALLTAAPQRLRPILMTSLTIIAAAIPTALALGPGSEVRVPMSLVIIGGILVSTFLTLFVVPCAYSVFSRFEITRTPENEAGPAM